MEYEILYWPCALLELRGTVAPEIILHRLNKSTPVWQYETQRVWTIPASTAVMQAEMWD